MDDHRTGAVQRGREHLFQEQAARKRKRRASGARTAPRGPAQDRPRGAGNTRARKAGRLRRRPRATSLSTIFGATHRCSRHRKHKDGAGRAHSAPVAREHTRGTFSEKGAGGTAPWKHCGSGFGLRDDAVPPVRPSPTSLETTATSATNCFSALYLTRICNTTRAPRPELPAPMFAMKPMLRVSSGRHTKMWFSPPHMFGRRTSLFAYTTRNRARLTPPKVSESNVVAERSATLGGCIFSSPI